MRAKWSKKRKQMWTEQILYRNLSWHELVIRKNLTDRAYKLLREVWFPYKLKNKKYERLQSKQ